MSRPQNLRQILSPGCDQVRNLVAEIHRMQDLTRRVRGLLPADTGQHLSLVTLAKNGMILWTDSAAWATRLRYSAPTLAASLHNHLQMKNPLALTIRVLPTEMLAAVAPRAAPRLSAAAGEHISASAQHTTDPQLRAAWQRLARSIQKPAIED